MKAAFLRGIYLTQPEEFYKTKTKNVLSSAFLHKTVAACNLRVSSRRNLKNQKTSLKWPPGEWHGLVRAIKKEGTTTVTVLPSKRGASSYKQGGAAWHVRQVPGPWKELSDQGPTQGTPQKSWCSHKNSHQWSSVHLSRCAGTERVQRVRLPTCKREN